MIHSEVDVRLLSAARQRHDDDSDDGDDGGGPGGGGHRSACSAMLPRATGLIYSDPLLASPRQMDSDDQMALGAEAATEPIPQRAHAEHHQQSTQNSTHAANGGSGGQLHDSRSSLQRAQEPRLRSEFEIGQHHYRNQSQYKKQAPRHRRLTDIDFEGILKLIGGCNRWQMYIYLLISVHQVPHAMFNLSVVYMMYQPDHWCDIAGFNETAVARLEGGADWEQVLTSGIAFPMVPNKQRQSEWHSQCDYYDRNYTRLLAGARSLTELLEEVQREDERRGGPPPLQRCQNWDYARNVMRETAVTQWNRVCDDNWSRAHVHMAYSLGYLLGCLAGGFFSDRYGRHAALCLFGVASLLFGIMLPFAKDFPLFLLLRFLLAAANEAADLAAYVLCMEVTGVKYRSMVGSMLQAPWACGYAFLALLAYVTKSWKTIQHVTVILHGLSMILIFMVPESPRWLILMDNVDKAEEIIRRACALNKSRLPEDLGLVRHAERRKWMAAGERPSFTHLFRAPHLRLHNSLLLVLWIATALVYYGLVIALSDQSSPGRSVFVGNFFLNNAIAGAIELPTLVGCAFLLRYGRKRSQMVTLIGAGILIFIAMLAAFEKHTTLALVFMLLGKVCIQGAFNVLYIFTSELNPTVVRNSAVGVSSMIARMGSGASGYIAILSDVTLPIVPMLIFCIFSLFAGCLVTCLPETQDLPLPDTILDAVAMLDADPNESGARFCGRVELNGLFMTPHSDEDEDDDLKGGKSNPNGGARSRRKKYSVYGGPPTAASSSESGATTANPSSSNQQQSSAHTDTTTLTPSS